MFLYRIVRRRYRWSQSLPRLWKGKGWTEKKVGKSKANLCSVTFFQKTASLFWHFLTFFWHFKCCHRTSYTLQYLVACSFAREIRSDFVISKVGNRWWVGWCMLCSWGNSFEFLHYTSEGEAEKRNKRNAAEDDSTWHISRPRVPSTLVPAGWLNCITNKTEH